MLAKARSSCLGPADVKKLQFEPFTEDHELDIYPKWSGFRIPYFSLDGKVDKAFYRFRFTQTQPSKGFASVTEEPKKPRRYSQPPNTQCGVYLPPLLALPWASIAKDPANTIVITEGELKAACACKYDVPTIGLGGVYNWKAKGVELLPILEKFAWEGRKVIICFDSDADSNLMVRLAASRLAYVLAMRGAVVSQAKIPPADDAGTKQGLDDFIFAHSDNVEETLFHLLQEDAENLGPSRELHRLNAEVAVIRATAEVVELSSGNVYSPSAFSETLYKHRTYMSQEYYENRDTRKFAAKEWLTWPLRTEVPKLVYAPECNNMLTEEGAFNTWHPQRWAVEPSSKGTIAPWERLFNHVLSGLTDEERLWARRWFAYPIQHPGTKLATAILVWGAQTGTGKSRLGETMGSIYGRNYTLIDNDILESGFTEWAENKQFIVGDEISIGDKRGIANKLKSMITRPSFRLNVKNRKTYDVRDCINYFLTSNHDDAVYLENHDRRYLIVHADIEPLAPDWYTKYMSWLEKEGGAGRLFHHFKYEVDLGDFNPQGRAPVTAAKREMMAAGRSDVEDWAAQLVADPDSVLTGQRAAYDLFTVEELLSKFDPDKRSAVRSIGLGRALTSAGALRVAGGSNNIVISGVRRRLYALRNVERYRRLSPSEAQKAYEAERSAEAAVGRGQKFAAGQRVGRVQ